MTLILLFGVLGTVGAGVMGHICGVQSANRRHEAERKAAEFKRLTNRF
jgi:ABC-type cobalt transport system substrate-binding protein